MISGPVQSSPALIHMRHKTYCPLALAACLSAAGIPAPGRCSPSHTVGPVADRAQPQAALSYSTYLGGSDAERSAITLEGGDGATYFVGETLSGDYPGRRVSSRIGRGDVYVTKLMPSGSIAYSVVIGGSDFEAAL